MTTTACCTRKSVVYQIQLRTNRRQISSILSQTSSTTICSVNNISTPIKFNKLIKNDINNNTDQQMNDRSDQIVNETIDQEELLSYVGLRRKTKPKSPPIVAHRPLAKRLAAPVCLLPLPKNKERVRQALYILLPFLKFLSINTDLDQYCLSNEQVFTNNLQLRTAKPTIINNKPNKRKVSKEEFLVMAANTFRNQTQKTPMTKYIHSTIQCQVVIDRLDQAMIDQFMTNSSKCSIEKTLIKHQSPMTTTFIPLNKAKRLKTSDTIDDKYRRIYLKCFVCSKREFIQGETTNSDILHSHWLEHGNDLLLNIYDSEIEQILTRVVEFFSFPRRHVLEGKIQTVFILNSKEIRKTPLKPFDDDDCIILD